MQAIDMNAPDLRLNLKALVYGKSGTGKTGFGVSAPRPLILLNEGHAKPHIIAAAARLGRERPMVIWMQTIEDYRDVLRGLRGDRSLPFVVRSKKIGLDGNTESVEVFRSDVWPETVVVDSVTEACDLVQAEIRMESPPKMGSDGLPVDSERYWGVFEDRGSKLFKSFRDLDMNVLFLALLDDKMVGPEGSQTRWVGPSMKMRKFPGVLMASVNVVGITKRRLRPDGTNVYSIGTVGPSFMELKPFPPIRTEDVMDFTSWCKRVNGVDDGQSVPVEVEEKVDDAGRVEVKAREEDKAPTVAKTVRDVLDEKKEKSAAARKAVPDTKTKAQEEKLAAIAAQKPVAETQTAQKETA